MSDPTTPDMIAMIVSTFEQQDKVNQALNDTLNTIAERLESMEARLGAIARNLPRLES